MLSAVIFDDTSYILALAGTIEKDRCRWGHHIYLGPCQDQKNGVAVESQ